MIALENAVHFWMSEDGSREGAYIWPRASRTPTECLVLNSIHSRLIAAATFTQLMDFNCVVLELAKTLPGQKSSLDGRRKLRGYIAAIVVREKNGYCFRPAYRPFRGSQPATTRRFEGSTLRRTSLPGQAHRRRGHRRLRKIHAAQFVAQVVGGQRL